MTSEFHPDNHPGIDPRSYDMSMDISRDADNARGQLQEDVAKGAKAALDLKAMALADAIRGGKMAYISPTAKNKKLIVRRGHVQVCYAGTNIPVVAGAPASQGTEVRRIGDLFAHFSGGILVVDPETEEGKVIIEWAEKHDNICRNAMTPEAEAWAAMKSAQLELADREPSMPKNLDVDAILRGDFSGFGERTGIVARARRLLEADGVGE